MKKEYAFNVNGFETKAVYDEHTVSGVFLPLLRAWTAMHRQRNRRILVFLSAPPGTGKTTLAQFLEYLSAAEADLDDIQAVGLDGFHYHQDHIASHTVPVDGVEIPMQQVKGSPETYDIQKLIRTVEVLKERDVKWPVYDRNLHDVVEDAVTVTKGIVLIEGNWLLSTEGPWKDLITQCDDSVFIHADSGFLKERLILRKMKGGLSRADAEAFFFNSDRKNVERLLQHHHTARVKLAMQADGTYIRR